MASNASTLFLLCLLSCGLCMAKDWHSGQIVSLDTFKYGTFEIRMTGTSGSAGIMGFVLIVPDPLQGWQEIGFEQFGKDPPRYQTQIIVPSSTLDPDGQPRSQYPVEATASAPLNEDFHTYRIDWTPSYIAWSLDGQEVRRETDASKYAQFFDASKVRPMEIRVTLWAGHSNWSGMLDPSNPPTDVKVDYIQVNSGDQVWRDDFDTFDMSRWRTEQSTDVFTENDFVASNVNVMDGILYLSFTHA